MRQGHDVTLFASGDSVTSARLVPCAPAALRLNPAVRDPIPHHLAMLERVRQRADEFDVLHFHIDLLQFPLLRTHRDAGGDHAARPARPARPAPLYRDFPDIAAGLDLRRPAAADAAGALGRHRPPRPAAGRSTASARRPRPDGYLAFLGRISPEKRPDRAIEIATRAGLPPEDRRQGRQGRPRLLASARSSRWSATTRWSSSSARSASARRPASSASATALLFPIDWPEPFGLVMIEAMACGTPVIAFPCGSVARGGRRGVTGFLVESVEEAVAAVEAAAALDRAKVRAAFERRFAHRADGRRLPPGLSFARRREPPADRARPAAHRLTGGSAWTPGGGPARAEPGPTTEVVPVLGAGHRLAAGAPPAHAQARRHLRRLRPQRRRPRRTRGSPEGIYHRDTRYLSHLCDDRSRATGRCC